MCSLGRRVVITADLHRQRPFYEATRGLQPPVRQPDPRSLASVTRRGAGALILACLAATALAAGCSDADRSSPGTSAAATATSPSPTPTPAGRLLAGLATTAAATDFVGEYALDSVDPKKPDATVRVYRLDSAYRVDVQRGRARSVLMTATQGLVSCQLEATRRTCLLVGKAGATPPRLFDPGVQRLFTSDLKALAAGTGLTVTDAGVLPASGDLPAARCFEVEGPGVDAGEYCLSSTGVLRKAQFPSGTLELTRLSGPPSPKVFVPPARPVPLPG